MRNCKAEAGKMSERGLHVAIVGGGASAALFLTHLSLQDAALEKVTVYDAVGRYARGIAYSTPHAEHLLNVRAAGMSARDDDAGHFAGWLAAQGLPYAAHDFVPRQIYGQYLSDCFSASVGRLTQGGAETALRTEEVLSVSRCGDGTYRIATPQREDHADAVVVATGNTLLAQPPGAAALSAAAGYYAEPWRVDYQAVAAHPQVIILGSGLSTVDAIVSLHRNGFTGEVTVISRHGLLPAPHVPPETWPAFFTDRLPVSALDALRVVRAQTAAAQAQGVPWQAVIDAIRPETNKIWLSWSDAERARFMRLSAYWSVHRHRMPPQSADIMTAWRAQGMLHIRKDRIAGIRCGADGLRVDGGKGIYAAPVVINCLGYKAAKNGFQDLTGAIAGAAGEGLYAIGPALSGYLLETTAVPEIRRQAAEVARHIAGAGTQSRVTA